jgi:hypothetical protein
MNIFVLDENPAKAAQMLCDCHLRKMCVETAQILSGVMLRNGMELLENMPQPQNINHPVIKAIDTPEKKNWVWFYFWGLLHEFCYRFGEHHKYVQLTRLYFDELITQGIDDNCANLAKCTGDLDVADLDIVTAYRKYYKEVKKTQLQAKGLWKFTSREDWTNEQ